MRRASSSGIADFGARALNASPKSFSISFSRNTSRFSCSPERLLVNVLRAAISGANKEAWAASGNQRSPRPSGASSGLVRRKSSMSFVTLSAACVSAMAGSANGLVISCTFCTAVFANIRCALVSAQLTPGKRIAFSCSMLVMSGSVAMSSASTSIGCFGPVAALNSLTEGKLETTLVAKFNTAGTANVPAMGTICLSTAFSSLGLTNSSTPCSIAPYKPPNVASAATAPTGLLRM